MKDHRVLRRSTSRRLDDPARRAGIQANIAALAHEDVADSCHGRARSIRRLEGVALAAVAAVIGAATGGEIEPICCHGSTIPAVTLTLRISPLKFFPKPSDPMRIKRFVAGVTVRPDNPAAVATETPSKYIVAVPVIES